MLIYQITDAFELNKLKYAIVGGYAMALHGVVRATMDVDLVIRLEQSTFEKAERILNQIGLSSRLPVRAQDLIKMREEYIENRNLVAWSFVDFKDPSRQVDILITLDVQDLDVERMSVGGRKISVVSLDELIKMKTEAGRPQDLIDLSKLKEKRNEKK